jgi:hypothetical protein
MGFDFALKAIEEGCLGGLDPTPGLRQREPGDTIDLRERLDLP